jgi:ankyrin repeat protein
MKGIQKIIGIIMACSTLYIHAYLNVDLLKAAQAKKSTCFAAVLKELIVKYHGNQEGFFNVLLYFALIDDIENLSILFDGLKKFYGNDVKSIFRYLDTRTSMGTNALGLSEYNGNRRTVELVLLRVLELIKSDKDLFFKFINAADHEHGMTALIDSARDSESNNLINMVTIAARVFGRHSKQFKAFINTEDFEGNTALSLALSNPDKFFLMSYGAQEPEHPKPIDPKMQQAHELGKKLIRAGRYADFKLFKLIIEQALREFSDNEHMLYHFFATNDSDGWNVLIHSAAEGQYEFVKLILDTIERHFIKTEKELKSLLINDTDFEGRTALHMAILRHHHRSALLILDKLIGFSTDKPVLFSILNSPDELNGHTPFISAIYASGDYNKGAYDFIKSIITTIADVFGQNTRMFELFINARDYNNWTALSYVSDDKIRDLLKSYGAIDIPMKKIRDVGDIQALEIHGEI